MEVPSDSEIPASQCVPNSLQTTISVEMEVPLCDQSVKRHIEEGDDEAFKRRKAMKKRRSSLSTKRRSIVGDIPTDIQTDASSDSASQESRASSRDQPVSSQDDGLKPNPANLRLDAVIVQMEEQIQKLNEEYNEWQEILNSHRKKEEDSKTLLCDLKLPASSVPDDVKQLSQSKYMRVKPLDLEAARGQVSDLLEQYQFDREACCQDLRLIKSTVETLNNNTKAGAARLHQALEQKRETEDNGTDNSIDEPQRKGVSDPKEAIAKFISNC